MANMTEQQIFDFLLAKGCTPQGAAGLMGNLIHESGLKANNLQNSYEVRLKYNDETYTKAVDDGTYKNFVNDCAGYGLAQWTYFTRKQALLNYARAIGASIGDCEMQMEFLIQEIMGYKPVWNALLTTSDIRVASDFVLTQYEKPADQSEAVKVKRANTGKEVFARCYHLTVEPVQPKKTSVTQFFSNLVKIVVDFANKKSNPRTEQITKITPHHFAGFMKPDECAVWHRDSDRDASANYYIGNDGTIVGGIPENRRAWTSSSAWNDQRAITIEVANSKGAPNWEISDAAYNSLVKLCADVCKRYNFTPKYTGNKDGSITTHRMFWATACPGAYLTGIITSGKFERDILQAMGKIVEEPQKPQVEVAVPFKVQVGAFKSKTNAEVLRDKLKKQGYKDAFVKTINGWHKVQAGAFSNKANAEALRVKLIGQGYKDAFIAVGG